MARHQNDESLEAQLEFVWQLVDELGDLSVRLKRAADAAMESLSEPKEES